MIGFSQLPRGRWVNYVHSQPGQRPQGHDAIEHPLCNERPRYRLFRFWEILLDLVAATWNVSTLPVQNVRAITPSPSLAVVLDLFPRGTSWDGLRSLRCLQLCEIQKDVVGLLESNTTTRPTRSFPPTPRHPCHRHSTVPILFRYCHGADV